ncbi:Wzy polymerase domain-containing protein [Chromobacterium piscinae]|uniref:Wzy polymerase domain-containing protein n=1 Tax=Chromobacterium piscinae TaxID=686831 RepID=A0ABV0H644_9NEIS
MINSKVAGAGVFAFFVATLVLPFLNFARYTPLPDWWTDALVVLAVGAVAPFSLKKGDRQILLPTASLALLVLALVLAISNGLFLDNIQGSGQVIASLLAMLMLSLWLGNRIDMPLPRVCVLLAGAVLLGNSIQIMLGLIQALNLAPWCRGMVLFDYREPTTVMGNLAQRNQYAQYLNWGLPAACYLYAQRYLRASLCAALVFVLAILISWSGARLPLAYGLGLCFLAWLWFRRGSPDPVLRRMVAALALSVMALSFMQLFNHELIWLLNRMGVPIHAVSGSERMLDAGFGARRRVEWTKALQVFIAHPWLGVGLGRYAAQSVWLETFGGLPKYPESWLFTQSHNLIFQLLAETGAVGALIVISGLLMCLLPFFGRGRQDAEHLLLLSLAMMLLMHSMFEFPLWYLPFLAMLVIVCVLGPAARWRIPVRTGILRWVCILGGVLMLVHVASGAVIYWRMLEYNVPNRSEEESARRVDYIGMVGSNLLWARTSDLVLSNYLIPERKYLVVTLPFYEKLARDQPYAGVLLKLSVCRALAGQANGAREVMAEAIANYPDDVPKFVLSLQSWGEPEVQSLREMALRAAQAYQEHGANIDAGRVAAVMTVAAPVTRKPLF